LICFSFGIVTPDILAMVNPASAYVLA